MNPGAKRVILICWKGFAIPICSMYGIFIYLHDWFFVRVNVGKYSIHAAFGIFYNLTRSFFKMFFASED